MPAQPTAHEKSPVHRKLSLSRRQFWRVVTVAAAAAAVPAARHVVVRRRRKGEPGPTGWFGHC
jgi:anti-sigma-K factor RskA